MLANIDFFNSLQTRQQEVVTFNAPGIDLTKRNQGIDLTKKSPGIDLKKQQRGTREGNDILMRLQQLQKIADTVSRMGDDAEKQNLSNIYKSIIQAANYSLTRLTGDRNATMTVSRSPEANRMYTYKAF